MKVLSIVKMFGRLALLLVLAMTSSTFAAVPQDYDGDGKTDLAVVRLNPDQTLTTYILRSRDGFKAITSSLRLNVFGDFDGDGKADLFSAVSNGSNLPLFWTIIGSRDEAVSYIHWGLGYDSIVPQDYDGDGKTDLAVYRGGWWYIRNSSNGQLYAEKFGRDGAAGTNEVIDEPFAGGDYDGDGKADLAILRRLRTGLGGPILMTMYLRLSRDATLAAYDLGNAQFTGVVAGDYDGDGRADVAIWRGNEWLWIRSSDNQLGGGIRFGSVGLDRPVVGDYDGDGKYDPAVYRFNNGGSEQQQSYFYTQQSRDGFKATPWGIGLDYPIYPFGSYLPSEGP